MTSSPRADREVLSLVRLLNSLLLALGIALLLADCKKPSATAAVDPNGPVEVAIPEHGVYTGAFMDFGDAEDDVTLETIEDFEQMVGKHQAIIASSSYWGEQDFPVGNLNVIWRHGSLPLVFWSPWDRPYEEEKGPETFRKAFRYVVDRVRARGASNIKWMFHTNNYPYPYETWNCAPAYYPGSDYVDWLGLSVYGQQFKDEPNPDIPSLVDWPYREMCNLDPKKPIMIAEWATGEFPHSTEGGGLGKTDWIKQGLKFFRTRYPRVKAAVYWHERWQNLDQSYSNLRVNSSVESLNAYREGVANPDWLGDLLLRPIPKK